MALYEFEGRCPTLVDQERCYIAPGTHLIGDVHLGVDSSVWFGAQLRGDNEPLIIGDGSNVQENCVFHTDPGCPLTIGTNTTIGHGVILHGCTIGSNVIIGMGAIIMNRSIIPDNSIVGAGSLITEDKQFDEGHLIIGRPAKDVRPLNDEEIIGIAKSAQSYIERGQRFKKSCHEM